MVTHPAVSVPEDIPARRRAGAQGRARAVQTACCESEPRTGIGADDALASGRGTRSSRPFAKPPEKGVEAMQVSGFWRGGAALALALALAGANARRGRRIIRTA